jgi:cardiolipin synthase
MIVLDDRVAFVGGINVSEHNYAWHDFMVRIEGPLAGELGADHESTWNGRTDVLDQSRPDRDYVLNHCAGRPSILDEVLRLVRAAEHRITFESPYLLGDRIESELLDAARRGVDVTLVLPRRANHLHARVWVRQLLRRLRHPNIRCYGYRPCGGMTHSKLLIVDDRIATFGSLNFLELEALTQKELNVFTRDPAIIEALDGLVRADVAESEPLPVPSTGFGRFTYDALHGFFRWWTARLVRDAAWRATYC